MDRPVAKAAVSALRGAVSAIRSAMVSLAAGGGAVIAVVLVLCLVAALIMSPLGIFFNGEEIGGQTIADAVREINQEYSTKLEELKSGIVYDQLSTTGARAPWPEVLAVYAVKTTSDPTNGQEVVTMDDGKKDLLKLVFWDMNEVSSFTSTVSGEDDEEDTTTLHITVTAKTADEMADVYGFNASQRQQLSELLSNEYRELWNSVLYGIGTGSGEIVAVALSQVGNVGAVSPIGVGTVSATGWIGAPFSSAGVQISVVTLKPGRCQNSRVVCRAPAGSRSGDCGRIGAIHQIQGTLSFSTGMIQTVFPGRRTECPTM